MQAAPSPAAAAGLRMLKDHRYSDLKITNSTHSSLWHVHKAIVCARCPFFELCLRHSFSETQSNTIDLPEDKPAHIEYLLRYLYTLDVDVAAEHLSLTFVRYQRPPLFNYSRQVADKELPLLPAPQSFAEAFHLFALADKLQIPDLRLHWLNLLGQIAQNLDKEPVDISKLAFTLPYHVPGNDTASTMASAAASFLAHCYECENAGIQDVRTKAIASVGSITDGRRELVEALSGLILKHPDLGCDLAYVLATKKRNQPVLDMLKYEAVGKMFEDDPKIAFQLFKSLALS